MIKITLRELVGSRNVLLKISRFEVSAKNSFIISKFTKKIESEFVDFTEKHDALVTKYGTKNDEDGKYMVSAEGENWVPFNNELKELLDLEIEIPIEKVDLEILEENKITSQEFTAISFLFKEQN